MIGNKHRYVFLILIISWAILTEVLPTISMPEINGDEAFTGIETLRLIKNSPEVFYVDFLGRRLSITSTGRHGALELYLLLPFLYFRNATIETLRMMPIFLMVIIIILTYYFSSKFFNPTVGLLSIVLLAINSPFIIFMKYGALNGFSLPFFTVIPLLFFYKWHTTEKNLYFYLGMLFLGIGCNGKGWFIWFVISLFINAAILYFPHNRIRPRVILIGILCMFFGLAPLIYFNYHTRNLIRLVSNNFFITQDGVNNLDFFKNLFIRLEHLNYILIGPNNIYYYLKMFPVFFFYISLLWLVYLIFTNNLKRKILFILSLFVVMFVMTTFTFTGHWIGHLLILFPYIQILTAIAIFKVFCHMRYKWQKIIFTLLLVVLFSVNIARCFKNYFDLEVERQQKEHCSIYLVSNWLLKNKIVGPVVFDGTLHPGLIFCSNLAIRPNRLHRDDSHFFYSLKNIMVGAAGDDFFIFDINNDVEEYELFKQLSKELKRKIITYKEFKWSNGDVRYAVHALE